ncbi:MAG: DUF2225 domain-containing protein [Desulfobaccales bacterium]
MEGGSGRRIFLKTLLGSLSFGALSILSFKKDAGFKIANFISDVFSIRSADATTLSKRTFVCAYCGNIFSDNIPESTNTFGGKDSEFRVYAMGEQPIPFFIHTCPKCGSPDQTSIWKLGNNNDYGKKLSDQEKKEIGKFLISYRENNKVVPKLFTPSQKYEVLSNIFIIICSPSIQIAESYLYAAWMADDEEKVERSKFLREKAIDYFIKALNAKELTERQGQTVTYLIGELYRRIGNYEQAISWFSKVTSDSKILINLCDRQRRLCLEKKSHKEMINSVDGNTLLK